MKGRGVLPPGLISLAVIFSSMCLVVLALLTFSSAKNELGLARAYAKNAENVMAADFRCRQRLAEALKMLEEGRDVHEIALETACELVHNNFIFTEPIDENRSFRAELSAPPAPRIVSCRVVYTGEWSPDSGIEVWTGE